MVFNQGGVHLEVVRDIEVWSSSVLRGALGDGGHWLQLYQKLWWWMLHDVGRGHGRQLAQVGVVVAATALATAESL